MNQTLEDPKSAFQARYQAQRIAFAPFVFQAVKALRDFKILAIIDQHDGIDFDNLLSQAQLSPYALKLLLDIGAASEILFKKGENYHLSKTGYFIVHDQLTNTNFNFVNDVCYQGLFYLKDSLIDQRPQGLKPFGSWETIYQGLSQLDATAQKSWFDFDHFYSDMAFKEALPLVFKTKPKRLLDVGGNTGKWAILCAQHDPDVEIVIYDLHEQIELAKKNIYSNQLEKRIFFEPFDALNRDHQFPKGFDILWMSQFLDCFSAEQIVGILKKAAYCMDRHTALYILEPFSDRQKYDVAAFCLYNISLYFTCMANGNSKIYSSKEMFSFIESAGLKIEEMHDQLGMGHTLLKCVI